MGITFFKKFKKENLDINRISLDRKSIYSGKVVKLSQKLVTETGLYKREELEEVIGREKMGDLYFNGNLFDIVNQLTQLSSEEEAKHFILDLDELCKNYSIKDIVGPKSKKLNELLYKLGQYVDKCVLAKNNNKESVM